MELFKTCQDLGTCEEALAAFVVFLAVVAIVVVVMVKIFDHD